MSLRLAIYFQDATHDEAQRKLLERRREKRPATSRSNGRSTSSACCFSLFRSSSSSASRSRWCQICTKSSFGNITKQHSYLHVYFFKNPTHKFFFIFSWYALTTRPWLLAIQDLSFIIMLFFSNIPTWLLFQNRTHMFFIIIMFT